MKKIQITILVLIAMATFVTRKSHDVPLREDFVHYDLKAMLAEGLSTTTHRIPMRKIPQIKKKFLLPYATTTRDLWVNKMIICESGGDTGAINPKDLDGTPSYGTLQFKPATFWMYSDRYGIVKRLWGEEEGQEYPLFKLSDGSVGTKYEAMMDPVYQVRIIRGMMNDDKVKWRNEFPDCIRKHGLPPMIGIRLAPQK